MEVYLCGKAEKKQVLLIKFTDNTRMNHIGLREGCLSKTDLLLVENFLILNVFYASKYPNFAV